MHVKCLHYPLFSFTPPPKEHQFSLNFLTTFLVAALQRICKFISGPDPFSSDPSFTGISLAMGPFHPMMEPFYPRDPPPPGGGGSGLVCAGSVEPPYSSRKVELRFLAQVVDNCFEITDMLISTSIYHPRDFIPCRYECCRLQLHLTKIYGIIFV